MAIYRENEDIINIGAYARGSSKKIDHAIAGIDRINQFLRQDINERFDPQEAIAQMVGLTAAPEAGTSHEKV